MNKIQFDLVQIPIPNFDRWYLIYTIFMNMNFTSYESVFKYQFNAIKFVLYESVDQGLKNLSFDLHGRLEKEDKVDRRL